MNQTSTRYTKTAIVLHWLIALGIFSMFALGWYMS
ncbi:MAG TPA: cytochrome b, partial [Methylotenera sp.]|nr:cytochrome b [Methylotenera sp.]